MRIILKQILQSVGGTVEEAGNGKEVLEKLKIIDKPDVVLVDWDMPEINDLEFVRAVGGNPAYRTLPLMVVTTDTESSQKSKALGCRSQWTCEEAFYQRRDSRKAEEFLDKIRS